MHTPRHAVPESRMDTFTRSVLDLSRMFPAPVPAPPGSASRP